MADIKTVQLIVNSEQAKSKIAELNKQLDVAKQNLCKRLYIRVLQEILEIKK